MTLLRWAVSFRSVGSPDNSFRVLRMDGSDDSGVVSEVIPFFYSKSFGGSLTKTNPRYSVRI